MEPFSPFPRQHLLIVTGLSGPALDKRFHDGTICLLSMLRDRQEAVKPINGRYRHHAVPVDAVAAEIASRFTAEGLRWDIVADAAPHFWPELLRYDAEQLQVHAAEFAFSAIDRAERSDEPVLMVIAEYEGGMAGVTMGTFQDLADHNAAHRARGGATLLRWTAIPVQEAIKSVRSRADAAKIELPRYWAPPMTRAEIEALPANNRPAFMRGEP